MGKFYQSPRISSEFKDCSLPLTFDQFKFCSFKCQYCFATQFKASNPNYTQKEHIFKHINHKKLIEIFKGKYPTDKYYQNFLSQRIVFHWGGLNEPFCYFERKHKVGLEIIKCLAELKYPTLFSTKGLSMFLDDKEYMQIFEKNAPYKNFAFQFSIVTNNDKTAEAVEKQAPNTTDRLKAMKRMADLGYWCILRLRPFIIGISDIEIEDLLQRAKDNGAKAISLEFTCIDDRIVPFLKKNFDELSKIIGFDIVDYHKKLSPRERGGYLRLNRDVKEYFMRKIYIKCREVGLQINISDPDFKELNDTGCCCGLPEEYPDNSELTNWSKGQLTEQLIKLRKRYWQSNGEDKYLTFDEIDKNVFNNWYNDHRYLSDSLHFWQKDNRKDYVGHKFEFIEVWNNLRSPSNPYSYLHGLLQPVRVDKENRLIYEYKPRSYEYRWRQENIL